MKKIILIFILIVTVNQTIAQTYNADDVKRLIELSKKGDINSDEYKILLERNPDVKQLILNHRSNVKKQIGVDSILNHHVLESEHKYLLYLFEEETFGYIKRLWHNIMNSKFAADVSDIVVQRLEEETKKLEIEASETARAFKE